MSPVEQQISNLRPSTGSGLATNLHYYLIAGAVLLTISSIVLWHPIPLMFATFLALVGWGSRAAGPLLVAAIAAYDTATPTHGQVTISISNDGDTDRYYAVVSERGEPDWKYEFIPQGWRPLAGSHAVRIWRLEPETPPAITAVEAGILVPRDWPANAPG